MAKRKKDVVKQEEIVEDIKSDIPVELEEEKTSEIEEVKEEVHVYFDDEEDEDDD